MQTIIVTKFCLFCNCEYDIHPNWKSERTSKYCSRGCKDSHQKITYVGENNPAFGQSWSSVTREKHIAALRTFWDKQENRDKHLVIMKNAAERLGHWPGQNVASWDKRRQTYLEVYGVEHPWMNPAIRQKCENTSVARYGKHTWEIAYDAIKRCDTNIERKMSQLLSELGIEFIHPYIMKDHSFQRTFDFFIPSTNTLIETDGDYFHANPAKYDHARLDQTQKRTKTNDDIKNIMVKNTTMRLLRFWEKDILQDGFINILREALWAEN